MNYEKLSDAELAKLCATQVMGYAWWECMDGDYDGGQYPMACDWSEIGHFSYLDIYVDGGLLDHAWTPLGSDEDALDLIDAIDPTDFTLERSGGNWTADFGGLWSFTHVDRRRAIVVAALKYTAKEKA